MTGVRLLHLRMKRRPPLRASSKAPFQITLTLTDDMGEDFLDLPPFDIQWSLRTLPDGPCQHYTVRDCRTKRDTATLDPSRGPFFAFELEFGARDKKPPKDIQVLLSVKVAAPGCFSALALDDDVRGLADFLCTSSEALMLDSDDRPCLVLPTCSEAFSLAAAERLVSSERVARTLSTFRLPPSAALAPSQLTILEQPDLTLGAHLWHCALVLAYRLLHHRDVLGMDSHQIVELGAGCGLVSQLCAVLNSAARICATDLEDVVSVSTAANFERFRLEHPKAAGRMSVHSLDWAANLPAGLLVGTRPLTVLACDVLYNVESHQIFLDTVLRLFASAEKADAQCLIGYKQRTVGDAAFFDMARGEGLHVECLPGMGLAGVEIWRLARPR